MTPGAGEYRYPPRALRGDYLRAVIGLTVFAGPALFVPLSSVMVWLLGALGLLFAGFAVRTVARQFSVTIVDAEAVRQRGPLARSVRWDELDEVTLRFYSTWRDRTSGWMQLNIKGGGSAIRVDSALQDFDQLAEAAFSAAAGRGIGFDAMTRQNAGAMGLDLPEPAGGPF
ncbi:MAG: hypothetical protein TEF_05825 [Rhizobiales bacterium NRL2]|jgi:hypothetical protein|nr:MAG: hypothetical protein TEF_05825 [Rhizobiales bacterium NRL2]